MQTKKGGESTLLIDRLKEFSYPYAGRLSSETLWTAGYPRYELLEWILSHFDTGDYFPKTTPQTKPENSDEKEKSKSFIDNNVSLLLEFVNYFSLLGLCKPNDLELIQVLNRTTKF